MHALDYYYYNCGNDKMLEYDWFLTSRIYSLILLCNFKTVRFDLSDYQKFVIGQVKSDSLRTIEHQVASATSQWNFTTWLMITNQNQWKFCDQVSCPSSTGKEKWRKLTCILIKKIYFKKKYLHAVGLPHPKLKPVKFLLWNLFRTLINIPRMRFSQFVIGTNNW